MSWPVRAIRRIFPRTMVETAGQLVDSLVQSATGREIQLLDTSADCQNRQVTPNRFTNQRQSRCVALWIMQGLRLTWLTALATRIDIARPCGEHQNIQPDEQHTAIHLRTDR